MSTAGPVGFILMLSEG